MTFYNDLAFRLRMRRLPEDEVAQVMLTVRQHELASGENAAEAFPDVGAYAEQFPRGTYRSPVDRAIALLLGAVPLFFVANTVMNLSTGDYLLPPMPLLAASLVVFVGLVLLALRRTKRLPAAFVSAANLGIDPQSQPAEQSTAAQPSTGEADRRHTHDRGGRK
jgi:hypothetical protein